MLLAVYAVCYFSLLIVSNVYAVRCRIVLKDSEDAMDVLERDPRSLSCLLLAQAQVDGLQGEYGGVEGRRGEDMT
jgi:hypothetical protein